MVASILQFIKEQQKVLIKACKKRVLFPSPLRRYYMIGEKRGPPYFLKKKVWNKSPIGMALPYES